MSLVAGTRNAGSKPGGIRSILENVLDAEVHLERGFAQA